MACRPEKVNTFMYSDLTKYYKHTSFSTHCPATATVHLVYTKGSVPVKNCLYQHKSYMLSNYSQQ